MSGAFSRNLLLAALAGTVTCMAGGRAEAYVCGITGSAVAQAGIYDPFNSTGLPTTRITLDMSRLNPGGGAKTALVGFYLTAGADDSADGSIIKAVSWTPANAVNVYGLNQNIFYNVGAPTPNLILSTNTPSGYTIVDFSGNNLGSDNLTMTFDVTLPPNLDLVASKDLAFNVNYHCSGTGGGQPFDDTGTIPNALVFPIKVLSGLQASYSGTILDFGEVGDKTDTDISSNQLTYTKSGWVNVRSSGAYIVTMSSQNGYRMTYPGGDPNTDTQRLNYTAHFAGETVSSSNTTYTPVSCERAGLAVKQIPLTVELNEGGKTKAPSSHYQDIITITLSPEAGDVNGVVPCAN